MAHLWVIHSVYWSGSLMWMYRSREMAHRLTMLAVEHITSDEIHTLQKDSPNIQESRSFMSANGITRAAIDVKLQNSFFHFPTIFLYNSKWSI